MELMEFLITENHIWNGKELRKQVVGIPMGSPVSPHLANLFRYVVEAQFVEELLKRGQKEAATACEFTFGYIDDLCTFEGPLPTEAHYGIPMTVDALPKESVNFLGMKITATKPDRPPRLGIVEKQEEWDFNVIKYPHASSNIPWNQGSAVFKGQLIRYAVICNNLWDFQAAALRLAGRLILRGHTPRLLIASWLKYLEERWPTPVMHKYRMQQWFPVALAQLQDRQVQMHHEQGQRQSRQKPAKHWIRKPSNPQQESTAEAPLGTNSANMAADKAPRTAFQETEEEIHVSDEEDDMAAHGVTQSNNSDASAVQDLLDLAGRQPENASEPLSTCDRCDGQHHTDTCPNYPQPAEDHSDATMNKGRQPETVEDFTLPDTVRIVPQPGDGNCLFHAMAYTLRNSKAHDITGEQLRIEVADFIEQNPELVINHKSIQDRIAELNDTEIQKGSYVQHLRNDLYGGTLEMQVVAHKYFLQLMVFSKGPGQYRCIFSTEPSNECKGYLLYKGTGRLAHYDVLELQHQSETISASSLEEVVENHPLQEMDSEKPHDEEQESKKEDQREENDRPEHTVPENPEEEAAHTETEVEESQMQEGRSKRKVYKRNRLSLKKTTTQYSHICGICGELHTRRRASLLCKCGEYVHLKCMGYKTLDELEEEVEEIVCKCKQQRFTTEQHSQIAQDSRIKIRRRKVEMNRKQCTREEATCIAAALCIAAITVVTQEQSLLQQGQYVRLHGLNNATYNGAEGIIIGRESDKAQVELAGSRKILRVHCKNMSFMPTYRVSRCKLNQHCTVEITYTPEPVFNWPQVLTGTYYEYLGVPRTATSEEIKAAFKKLSFALHPDKNPNNIAKATQLFKQLREAYDCLHDAHQRAIYDRLQRIAQQPQPWPHPQPNQSRPTWQW